MGILVLTSVVDLRRHRIPNTFCILTAVAGRIAVRPARGIGQKGGPFSARAMLGGALS